MTETPATYTTDNELQRRMTELLNAILAFKVEHVYSPCATDLAETMNLSQAECSNRIKEAEGLGLLTKASKNGRTLARTIQLEGELYSPPSWRWGAEGYVTETLDEEEEC